MKKKLFAILFAAMLTAAAAVSLTACGGGSEPADPPVVENSSSEEESTTSEVDASSETEEEESQDEAPVQDIDATLEDYIASDAVQNAVHAANQKDTIFYTELTASGHTIYKDMHLLKERSDDELIDMGDRFHYDSNHFPLSELVFDNVDVFANLEGIDEFADGISVTMEIRVYSVTGDLIESLCSTSSYEGK